MLLRELLRQPCPFEGPWGPPSRLCFMFSRAPPLGWLLPPPRPIQPSQTPRCLPQPWYLWGICVGEAAPLDQHNLMPMGRGCQAPLPPPCTDAERDIHILRHTDTHADTHDTVGVLLAPERVWKDGLSCSGPLRTFRANWRPVVLEPSWATTAILAPACQEDLTDTRSSIGPGSASAGFVLLLWLPFPFS